MRHPARSDLVAPVSGPSVAGPIRFPGLNGLRFIAAQAVVMGHAGAVLGAFGYPAVGYAPRSWLNPQTGKIAVILFFVLSGFLITYLLLAEQARTGTIHAGAFYLRRVLRIWPLYYLIVLCGFFVFPRLDVLVIPGWLPEHYDRSRNLLLYSTILPNLGDPLPYVSHLWSIGVEEQFYLLWPILLRSTRRTMSALLTVVALYLAALTVLVELAPGGGAGLRWLLAVVGHLRFDCMALGGLGAVVLIERHEAILRKVYSSWTQLATIAALGALYLFHVPGWFGYDAFAVLFVVLILNVCSQPRFRYGLDAFALDWLGKISYGIYMFHPVAAVLAVRLFVAVHPDREIGGLATLAVYSLITAMTILMAAFSYYAFELPFLRRKLKVSTILSGDFATTSGASEQVIAGRRLA